MDMRYSMVGTDSLLHIVICFKGTNEMFSLFIGDFRHDSVLFVHKAVLSGLQPTIRKEKRSRINTWLWLIIYMVSQVFQ